MTLTYIFLSFYFPPFSKSILEKRIESGVKLVEEKQVNLTVYLKKRQRWFRYITNSRPIFYNRFYPRFPA